MAWRWGAKYRKTTKVIQAEVAFQTTISSASVRLQRLRLACRSGARLIPILATRHGGARPGHACLDRYIQSTLNVARHAKKSEVEGEIESQIEYQEVQEGQAGSAAQAAEGCCQHSGAGGCCNESSRLRRQARSSRSGVKRRRGATSF